MVKKRSSLDRIEKVVRKKQRLNTVSESPNSPPKKGKNMLSDCILSLYHNELPPKEEKSSNKELVNCDDKEKKNKNVVTKTVLKNESSSNEELENYPDKIKESQQVQTTEKSKSSKSEAVSLKKKSSAFGLTHSEVTYKDVGGLDNVFRDIFGMFLYAKDPETFVRLGVKPRRGFLLHGPPGCGKTHLARAIAGEYNWPYIEVGGQELVCGISGESEGKIREMFEEAVKNAPCILFIDEIDAICPKRETTERGMEKRMVTQMLKCLDELNEMGASTKVMVIGATNRPDSLDPALRRGGRFDTEFAIGIPDEDARLIILKVLSKDITLAPDFDMQWLAHHTPGYVGADLQNLVTMAVEIGLKRIYEKYINEYSETQKDILREKLVQPSNDANEYSENLKDIHREKLVKPCNDANEYSETLKDILREKLVQPSNDATDEPNMETAMAWYNSDWKMPDGDLENIYFELSDFQEALKHVIPCTKREGFAMVPDTTWEDVGALKEIKEVLERSIMWPVKYRELCKRFCSRMPSTKGTLLYGPPGCGKTLVAKAIANECNLNFLAISGPKLLSMYLGESEKAVRQCFERARNSAPCVIFFDEIDSICPARSGSSVNAAADRVVTQLLTEMDGIEERKQVFVIGATNRLEKIDSAMLRPGRLGKIIFVDLPSEEERFEILKTLTKNKKDPKVADDVDLKEIASDIHCENFSGADLQFLVDAATDMALSDYLNSSKTGKVLPDLEIKKQHFHLAFSGMRPSVSQKERERYRNIYLSFRS